MNRHNLIRLFAFIPAIIIMLMIYNFSAEDSDASTSTSEGFTKSIVSFINDGLDCNLTEPQIDEFVEKIEHYVRKVAHFTEYLILAVSIFIPIYMYYVSSYKPSVFISESICFLYACSDEIHQFFIPGRAARFLDVIIDSMGSLTGIIICIIVINIRKSLASAQYRKCNSSSI